MTKFGLTQSDFTNYSSIQTEVLREEINTPTLQESKTREWEVVPSEEILQRKREREPPGVPASCLLKRLPWVLRALPRWVCFLSRASSGPRA